MARRVNQPLGRFFNLVLVNPSCQRIPQIIMGIRRFVVLLHPCAFGVVESERWQSLGVPG